MYWEKMAVNTLSREAGAGSSPQETSPAVTLISSFWPPELRDKFQPFELPSLWGSSG